MRGLFIALLFGAVLLAACSNSEKRHELTLADIRFPDPEQEAIVANGIADIVAYDTAELFKRNPKGREYYGHVLGRYEDDTDIFLGYALEYRLYDSMGNKIFYWRNNAMQLMCGYGIYPHRVYDSSGRCIYNWKREPGYRGDTFWYYLAQPGNKFMKVHHRFGDRDDARDTTTYTLDETGRPLLGTHYSRYWDDTGWNYMDFDTVSYTYKGGRLTEKDVHYHCPGETVYNWKLTELYYYKGSRLDSMSSTQEYPHKRWKMMDIHEYTKYDERGLPLRGLIADSLHVYYRSKKHGDPTIPDYSKW